MKKGHRIFFNLSKCLPFVYILPLKSCDKENEIRPSNVASFTQLIILTRSSTSKVELLRSDFGLHLPKKIALFVSMKAIQNCEKSFFILSKKFFSLSPFVVPFCSYRNNGLSRKIMIIWKFGTLQPG